MKLVSIIMPVYNCEKYVKEAISSILNQTHTNFELLIIDDNSTDSTVNIIKSFSDKRIRFFSNSTNNGIVKTLNAAIHLCKGDLIARMDGDDVSHHERIERQVGMFKENPQIGLVSCWYVIRDTINGKSKIVRRYTTDEEIRFHMLFRNQFVHPGVMMRAEVMKKLRYNDVQTCEDYDLWARSLKYCKVANCSEILLLYRWHGDNISYKNKAMLRKSMIFIISNLLTEYNIDHTEQELLLQTLIALGIKKDQLITLEKMDAMERWLSKLSASPALNDLFGSQLVLKEIKYYKNLYNFC